MRSLRLAVSAIIALTISVGCLSQKMSNGGIVYGSGIAAMVMAPDGWTFDDQAGADDGVPAVIYPNGSSWADAKERMYVNFSKMAPGDSMDSFIEADLAQFKEGNPKFKSEKGEPITLLGGIEAEVRFLSGDKWGHIECIAYARKGNSIAMFVLSCRSKEALDKDMAPFKEMLSKCGLMAMQFR